MKIDALVSQWLLPVMLDWEECSILKTKTIAGILNELLTKKVICFSCISVADATKMLPYEIWNLCSSKDVAGYKCVV